jgi:hypothetical protein
MSVAFRHRSIASAQVFLAKGVGETLSVTSYARTHEAPRSPGEEIQVTHS